jgi:hypothetical protein
MPDKNYNQKAAATAADDGIEMKPDKDASAKLKKATLINKDTGPDTAPDEHISPKADTDEPIDGQVLNDAVLRGEPHDENWPAGDKEQ